MDASEKELKKFLLEKERELVDRLENIKKESSREGNPISPDFEEQAVEREGEDVIQGVKRVTEIEINEIKIAI